MQVMERFILYASQNIRNLFQGFGQTLQVNRAGAAHGYAADQALQIIDIAQMVTHFLALHKVVFQISQTVIALFDCFFFNERLFNPVSQ